MEFAVEIAGAASKASGLEVIPWALMYGAELGTLTFSARVDSLAAMGAAGLSLASDTGYMTMAAKRSDYFCGPTEDRMMQFVAAAGAGSEIGDYVLAVRSQCTSGKIAAAMTFAVDVMNHVSKTTGIDVALVRSLYGPWATIGWVSSTADLDQIDAANAALGADAGYLERLDQAGDLFVPGSSVSTLARRLA